MCGCGDGDLDASERQRRWRDWAHTRPRTTLGRRSICARIEAPRDADRHNGLLFGRQNAWGRLPWSALWAALAH